MKGKASAKVLRLIAELEAEGRLWRFAASRPTIDAKRLR